MSFTLQLKRLYGSSQSCTQGRVIAHPKAGEHFLANSLTLILRGVSSVDDDETGRRESVIFLERSLELLKGYGESLPIEMYEDYRYSFYIPFPKDARLLQTREKDYELGQDDVKIPEILPPSGLFRHNSQVEYYLEASALDLKSGMTIKTRKRITFSQVRDSKEASAVGKTVTQHRIIGSGPKAKDIAFEITSPTTYLPRHKLPQFQKSLHCKGGVCHCL